MSEVPLGWREELLGEIAEVSVSNVDKKSRSGEIPVMLCNYLDAYREDYLDESHPYMVATATPSEVTKFGLRVGDIVVTKDSETPYDIGVAAVIEAAPDNLVCGYHLARVRPSGQLNSVWLAKQFGTARVQRYLAARATGSTRYGLSNAALGYLPILVPGREEQDRIIEVLRTLDEYVRHTEQLIGKLDQILRGLTQDLLLRGIDDNGELRDPERQPRQFKDSPLGRIPSNWEATEMGRLVDPSRPIVYGILMPGTGHSGGIPVVKVRDIVDGHIQLDNLLLTSPAIDAEYARSRLKPGDLLFTIRGTVGRTAFVPAQLDNANITQDSARIAIRSANPAFVRHYVSLPGPRRFVEAHTVGVAVRGINLRDVRRIPIGVPPRAEADQITKRLDAAEERLGAERDGLANLRLVRRGLMADLLTGRVRVAKLLGDDLT